MWWKWKYDGIIERDIDHYYPKGSVGVFGEFGTRYGCYRHVDRKSKYRECAECGYTQGRKFIPTHPGFPSKVGGWIDLDSEVSTW